MDLGQKSILIVFLLLCILSFSVFSYSYYEDFEYVTTFAVNGWNFNTFGGCTPSPPTSPFDFTTSYAGGTKAFGKNGTIAGCSWEIQKDSLFNNVTQLITLSFDYYINSKSLKSTTYNSFILSYGLRQADIRGRLYHNDSNVEISDTTGAICECNIDNYYNNTHRISLSYDRQNLFITLTIDGNGTNCTNIPVVSNTYVNGIWFAENAPSTSYYFYNFDNIQVDISDTNISGTAYAPCDVNTDCLSGKCEYSQCVLKLANEDCTGDSQCISSLCINGRCKKASLGQMVQESKTEQFGDDSATNNFISFILMVGLAGAVLLMGGVSSLGILLSIVVFVVSGFFFGIIGWLSPFILIGLVVAMLIVMVLVFMMRGQSG